MLPIRVFLIDDSLAFLSAAESFLATRPHVELVGRARLAVQALEHVLETNPDVVLIDLGSPELTGLIATLQLKAIARPPRVIILSDREELPYRALAEAVGADHYVPKKDFCSALPPLLEGPCFRSYPDISPAAPAAQAEPLEEAARPQSQPYGHLTRLNTSRLILDSVGEETLGGIVGEVADLLGTSAAVYERNGDYALRVVASDWCRRLAGASRALCGTDDDLQALKCGGWHCHESAWLACKACLETGEPVDRPCLGGIHIHAVPIRAGAKIIGAVNFGYRSPPRTSTRSRE